MGYSLEKNAYEDLGSFTVDYEGQKVKYDSVGKSIFDQFSTLGTPSLLCTTHREINDPTQESVWSQLRLGGGSKDGEERVRALASARIYQKTLYVETRDFNK